MQESNLRKAIIRLAYQKPKLRRDLLPLVAAKKKRKKKVEGPKSKLPETLTDTFEDYCRMMIQHVADKSGWQIDNGPPKSGRQYIRLSKPPTEKSATVTAGVHAGQISVTVKYHDGSHQDEQRETFVLDVDENIPVFLDRVLTLLGRI